MGVELDVPFGFISTLDDFKKVLEENQGYKIEQNVQIKLELGADAQ